MALQLNCDLGELAHTQGETRIEDALMPLLDQASIACGGHAGDQDSMRYCVRLAIRHDVSIGAHPSYPDRENFGRVSIPMPYKQLVECIQEQIKSLESICQQEGGSLKYVKPHGALYNDMLTDNAVRSAVIEAVHSYPSQLSLMVFADLPITNLSVPLIREAFADRSYQDNGELLKRSEKNAVHNIEKTLQQTQSLLCDKTILSINNKVLSIQADSICIHSDTSDALYCAQALRQLLNQQTS